MSKLRSGVVALAALVFSIVPAQAADTTHACEKFVLTGGERNAKAIDLGTSGLSLGDQRVGTIALIDNAGKKVGEMHWIDHIIAVHDDKNSTSIGKVVFVLEDGRLHGDTFLDFKAFLKSGERPRNATFTLSSGAGKYATTRGNVIATFEKDKPAKYEFEIHCD